MSFKEKFRQIKKLPGWIYYPAVWLLYGYKLLMRTEVIDPGGHLQKQPPPAVTITWHNRLLFFPLMFPKWHRCRTVAVISASRDGQYISDLVATLGIGSLRGSSKKKGFNALHGAVKAVQERKYVCFTPDGPRGPRYRMSPGPIYLASQLKVPLFPLAINYSSFWELKSWDGFRIPKPFAKVSLVIGEPIPIPENMDSKGIEEYRNRAEEALNKISLSEEERIKS